MWPCLTSTGHGAPPSGPNLSGAAGIRSPNGFIPLVRCSNNSPVSRLTIIMPKKSHATCARGGSARLAEFSCSVTSDMAGDGHCLGKAPRMLPGSARSGVPRDCDASSGRAACERSNRLPAMPTQCRWPTDAFDRILLKSPDIAGRRRRGMLTVWMSATTGRADSRRLSDAAEHSVCSTLSRGLGMLERSRRVQDYALIEAIS